ncbi:MAG: Gfo/Idh/MocA family oxidoreductase [Bdellovibrionota bacterium]
MSKVIRYGLVGAGLVSQNYAQAFLSTQASELVAVHDILPEAVKSLCAKTNARGYTDLAAMIRESNLDAVIICTPPSTHLEISKVFLKAGIHVLCEKPISINRASLDEMLSTAKQHGVMLSMASKFRYVKDVIRAKQMFELGLLGEVVLFENSFLSKVDMAGKWNSQSEVSGGGVFIDNGTHSVDIMRYLLGPIKTIKVVEGKRLAGLPVDETVHVLIRGTNGILGRIDLSWSIKQDNPSFITVHGSHGRLNIGWKESTYSLYSTGETVVFGAGYDKVAAFSSQINNFSDAICGRADSLISEADILASVEVIEAGYRSLRSTDWETVGSSTAAARPAANGAALNPAGLA